MKLTNKEVWEAGAPLGVLIGRKLPVGVSYNLATVASKLNEQFQIVDKVRNVLVRTYGKPHKDNPNTSTVEETSENFPKFAAEFDELLAKEVTIDFGGIKVPVELPGKVVVTCEACHHSMDGAFEIEPAVLMPLLKFVIVK